MSTPLAAAAAFEAGRQLGALAWNALVGGLLVLQLVRLRAPAPGGRARSRKGVWSGVLACGGAAGVQLVARLQPALPPLARVVLPLLLAAALLVAVVLGVQALVEVRAARRAGGAPSAGGAGWAIGLALLNVGAMVFGVVRAVGGAADGPVAALRAAAPAAPVRDEALNFRFEPPPGFRPLEAKKLNPIASIAYVRAAPQVFFVVVAEAGVDMTSEEVANVAETNLKASGRDATVVERGPEVVGGLAGIRLRSNTRVGNLDLAFVHWTYGANGFIYQLVTWGAAADAAAVERSAATLARGFALLDRERRYAAPPAPAGRRWSFHSPAWRYRVELDRDAFSDWGTLRSDHPAADFGARCDGCAVLVVPLRLPSPPPSLDAVARALADQVGLRYPGDGFTDRRPVRVPPAEGFEVSYLERQEKASWEWRLRTLVSGERAWLVAGWARAGDAAARARRDRGVEAVTFELPVAGAPAPAPSTPRELLRQARALNEMGLHAYDTEQYAGAAALFAEAAALAPGDRVLLRNAADAHARAGLFAEGLALVDRSRGRFPGDVELEALRALLASRAGREGEALRDYARLFARGLADDDHLRRYAELLEAAGRRGEALKLVARYRRRHDGRRPTLLQAALECRAGRPQAELATLRAALARRPDAAVAYGLVSALLEHGRKREALREAEAAVRRFPGTGPLLALRGQGELALGRLEEAKASFEKALEHDPASRETREYLAHVSALLGEGQNSSLKEPIEEVQVPAGLLGPAPRRTPEGYGAWFDERLVAISFVRGKELRRTDLWRGRATDAAGVERLGTFEVSFDPLAEQVFVNRVLVRDAHGRVVARGKPGDWYVSDQASGALGTQRRSLHVQVPGLRPGLVVEVAITRRDVRPPDRMDFVEHTLASSLPLVRSALVVTGDVDAVAAAGSEGVEPRRVPGALAFAVEAPPVFRPEPLRLDHQEWLPTAWLGPAGASWAAEARAYQEQIAAVDAPDAEVSALAAREAKGLEGDAKAFALARFVQKGLTYRAIEFGRRARVPHRLAEILQTRFGDCKDHALLLKRLLEAAGIPARLALVRADGPARPGLPSLDQFDHMIVWLPGPGAGRFMDATDKGAAPDAPPPGLGGKQALVLDGERARLVEIPGEAAGLVASERTVALGDGELEVHDRVRLEGPPAAAMRAFLAGTNPVDRAERLQGFLAQDGLGLRVTSVRLDGLEEVEKPLALELRYLVRGSARRGGAELAVAVPALWERRYLGAEPVPRRASPFQLTALEVRSTVELAPPAGRQARAPASAPATSGAFSRWERSARVEGGRVRVQSTLARPSGRFPAPRWDAYRDEMDRALSGVEPTVSVGAAP